VLNDLLVIEVDKKKRLWVSRKPSLVRAAKGEEGCRALPAAFDQV
jgi:hypothetical protein